MTDNEIIKALECCSGNTMDDCDDCPRCCDDGLTTTECMCKLMKDALDLINRQKTEIKKYKDFIKLSSETIRQQKAEIDRLNSELKATSGAALSYKAELERLTGKRNADPMDFCGVLCRYSEELITKAKAEAVKEVMERLKEKAFTHEIPFEANEHKFVKLVAVEEIDNLLKERVGETK